MECQATNEPYGWQSRFKASRLCEQEKLSGFQVSWNCQSRLSGQVSWNCQSKSIMEAARQQLAKRFSKLQQFSTPPLKYQEGRNRDHGGRNSLCCTACAYSLKAKQTVNWGTR
eukprot:1157263-Pelagomonas_calceolata.AAC.7